MNKNNNWIMLAIVCGIIAYAYMQQKKPALVFPLPSFKESFEDLKPDDYRFAWNLSRANIFKKKYPRHRKAIDELIKKAPPGLGQRYNEMIIKSNRDLIRELEKRGVKFTQAELRKMLPPMAKQVVVANAQAIAKPLRDIRELDSTIINLSSETFNKVKNTCTSASNQTNVLNIVGSNVTKLTTNQKNAAKNTCILQQAIQTLNDSESKNKLFSSLKEGLEQNGSAGIGLAQAEINKDNIAKGNRFKLKDSKKSVNEAIAACVMNIDQSNVINMVGSKGGEDVMMECLSGYGVVN